MVDLTNYIKNSFCTTSKCDYIENGINIDCDSCKQNMVRKYIEKIIIDFVDGYIMEDVEDCTGCDRTDDYCCIKCYKEGYLKSKNIY